MNQRTNKFFSFFRNTPQFFYGIILLVIIPCALVVNTLLLVHNNQQVVDIELQRKASLAASIISVPVSGLLTDMSGLQMHLETTAAANDEIRGLDVLVPSGDFFSVLASLDQTAVGSVSKYVYNTIAWTSGETVAYQTTSPARSTEDQSQRSDARYWVVVRPLTDASGAQVALISLKVSSEAIDGLTDRNTNRSLIVLGITVAVVVLLLANNTRLFQYALLSRKLQAADQMKDEFISMASHELRAPIAGIRGYLQMMIDKSFGELPREAEDKTRLLLQETNRLHDLVEDLLDVSRIEQGRIELHPKPLSAHEAAEELVQTFTAQASAKGLALVSNVPANLPQFFADPDKCKQILVNLVSNAIKYTPRGSVTIAAEVTKDRTTKMKIVVSDTGLGISARDRERLFEKFYRVRNEQTDKIIGTGLGLWITRELARMMKGEIYVDSIEKVGTHVSVILPLAQQSKN